MSAAAPPTLFRRPERGVLEVSGGDRVRWLDGMLSNDVTALEAGPEHSGCAALLLTRQGRIVADPVVLAFEDRFWLDVEREGLSKMEETLARFIVADRVDLTETTPAWDRLALEGPGAAALLDAAVGTPLGLAPFAGLPCTIAGAACVVAAWGITPEARQLWVECDHGEHVAERLCALGAVEATDEAHEILRIEAGVPRLLADLDESVLPAEAALEHAISFSKGCYTGQEVVARLASQGKPSHVLVGLRFDGAQAAPVSSAIAREGKRVGEVTSACESPAHGAIGLGFVRAAHAAPGTPLEVGEAQAQVSALPFSA